MIHFDTFDFHPVMRLPQTYEVYDLTQGYDADSPGATFSIGRYNEKRKNVYTTESWAGRDVHIGIDIGAPSGTEILAFFEGEIYLKGLNSAPGDYGPTLITEHQLGNEVLYALWGHLALALFESVQVGQSFKKGEVIARVGTRQENGGWNPHLHFQLCTERPLKADMPGVVTENELAEALKKYPDPRLVLGPLY